MSVVETSARSNAHDGVGGSRGLAAWRGSNAELVFYRVLVVVVFLALWEAAAATRLVNPFFSSRPSAIVLKLLTFLQTSDGWLGIGVTLYETLVGLASGAVLGIVSALLLTRWSTSRRVLNPFVTVLNSVPRLALTPLFIIWFGVESPSKIIMVFTLIYFPMLVATMGGIDSVDPDIVVVARLLGATRRQLMRDIVLPTCVPWVLVGLRVGLAHAFAGTIVAEMIAGRGGLGFIVSLASSLLDLTTVFAMVILVMTLAYVADVILLRVEKHVLRWRVTGLASQA